MRTGKAARYYNADDIRIEDYPIPDLKHGEILVKTKACGICGSDLSPWYMDQSAPRFFGHEPTGIVAETGDDVENIHIDDRVFVHHHVPCFICHFCQRGYYTMCSTFKQTNIYPGGFSEYFVVPALNVQRDTLKLPDTLNFEDATLIEPLACCIKGMKKANVQPGDTVAVLGVGFMGLMHIQLARIFGAAKIIAIDSINDRLNKALELGADMTVNYQQDDVAASVKEVSEGYGADIVVVTSGSIEAINEGINIAAKGATLYLYAPLPQGVLVPLELNHFFFSEITFVTSYSASPLDTRLALEFINTARVNVKGLITHRYQLSQIGEALRSARQKKESLKVIVVMD